MEFSIRGLVARAVQAFPPQADGGDSVRIGSRMGKYNELYTMTPLPPKQVLCDEGTYFTVNNGQAGIAMNISATGFLTAVPYLMIYNGSQPSAADTRVYFDYTSFVNTATGVSASGLLFAIVTDTGNRYVSGGTNLTSNIVNTNMDLGVRTVCNAYCGAIAVTAQTSTARTIVGQRYLNSAPSPTLVVGDQYNILFGPVDPNNSITVNTFSTGPTGIQKQVLSTVPPLIIGPNQSMLLYLWEPGLVTTASSYAPEAGWIER